MAVDTCRTPGRPTSNQCGGADYDYRAFIDLMLGIGQEELTKCAKKVAQTPYDDSALAAFKDAMTKFWLDGTDELQRLFPDSSATKEYFRMRAGHLLAPSVFYKRAFEKPNGYAGDYLVMDMMYERRPLPGCGTHPLSGPMDEWFLDAPSARANRNRQTYLVDMLRRHLSSGAKRIASLASGPCREAVTYLRQQRTTRQDTQFIFVDWDQEALDYAERQLREHCGPREFVNANLLKFALGKTLPTSADFDLVYCIGFADYIDDRILTRFVQRVYDLLLPGGTFVLGHFLTHKTPPDRFAMEWSLDWNLIYRSSEEIARVFADTSFSDVRYHHEPMNLIGFAEASKP